MASALGEKSCDMIGVARPLTAEVNFPKMIILGEIERARESRMLNSLTTPAAIIQMKQVRFFLLGFGRGKGFDELVGVGSDCDRTGG